MGTKSFSNLTSNLHPSPEQATKPHDLLTCWSSSNGSNAEPTSSGFSMYLRRCSRREVYALRESTKVRDHPVTSVLWKSKKIYQTYYFSTENRVKLTFQHTERSPALPGLSSPSSLTDFLRASRLLACPIVTCHRALGRGQYVRLQSINA
jgi:hypothetical protein